MTDSASSAILGASITALVAVIIFIVERGLSRRSARIEVRRIIFGEVMEAFSLYAREAIRSHTLPGGTEESELLTSRARLELSLRRSEKALGFWVNGMQTRMTRAASPAGVSAFGTIPSLAQARLLEINAVLQNLCNSLIDLHRQTLTMKDFTMAGNLFFAESSGVNIDERFPNEIADAMRPRPKGRFYWLADSVKSLPARVRFRIDRFRHGAFELSFAEASKRDGESEQSE